MIFKKKKSNITVKLPFQLPKYLLLIAV